MIERNLGNIERLLRLIAGILMAAWALSATQMNAIEWVALVAAVMLILNSTLSRCYLWSLLGINSCDQNPGKRCSPNC
jgi:uncharacterized membrane protein